MKIRLANEDIELKPLTPLNGARLLCLLYPHLHKLPIDLIQESGDRFLFKFIEAVGQLNSPDVLLRTYAAMVDVPYEWLAANATAEEILLTLPTLQYENIGLIDLLREVIVTLTPVKNG